MPAPGFVPCQVTGLSIGPADWSHLALQGGARLPIARGWRTHQTSRQFEVSGDLRDGNPRGLSGVLKVRQREVTFVAVVVIDPATSTRCAHEIHLLPDGLHASTQGLRDPCLP